MSNSKRRGEARRAEGRGRKQPPFRLASPWPGFDFAALSEPPDPPEGNGVKLRIRSMKSRLSSVRRRSTEPSTELRLTKSAGK